MNYRSATLHGVSDPIDPKDLKTKRYAAQLIVEGASKFLYHAIATRHFSFANVEISCRKMGELQTAYGCRITIYGHIENED